MPALLYFVTAALLVWIVRRWVSPMSRAAALALVLFPLLFTGRALLTGRVYAPVDIPYIVQPLLDHRAEMHVGVPRNPALSDIALQMIPWREATRRSVAAHQWPLLNPFESCGDVLAGSAQPAVFSPFTWIALLLPSAASFTFTASIAFFIAGISAFVFARELRCSQTASLVAAAVWMFSAPIALQILWPLAFAWTLLPLVLAGVHRVISAATSQRESRINGVALLTVALLLEIVAGHPETLLHVVAVGTVYGIFELVSRRTLAPLLPIAAAGLLALLLGAVALLPFLDAEQQTVEHHIRRDLFARQPLRVPAGQPLATLMGDAFPFLRDQQQPLQRSEGGSIALALALFAATAVRRRETWFFVVLGAFALLAGAGVWPIAHALHRLPLFDMALNERLAAVVPLCLAVLAAFAVDAELPRRAAAVTIALTAIIAVAAVLRPVIDVRTFVAEFALLSIAAAIGFVRVPHAGVIIMSLILLQRTIADGDRVPVYPREAAYPALALFEPLKTVPGPFRITGSGLALVPNTATMYGLEDVRGSSAMTLQLLAETFPMWTTARAGDFLRIRDLSSPWLSMLNVRYAVLDVSDPIPDGWHDVTYDIYTRLIENDRVLPRAFVPRLVRIGSADVLSEMSRESDFAQRAWIDGPPAGEQRNGPGVVKVSKRGTELHLDVDMEREGYVVVSNAAWRGWRASVDGRAVRTLVANHAFIAVWIPAGHHTARLKFLPQSFLAGSRITAATALLLILAALLRWLRRAKRPGLAAAASF